MTENPKLTPEVSDNGQDTPAEEIAPKIPRGPTVPKPHNRAPDIDRKIRMAVENMLEDVDNPYEAVVAAAQEARRMNEHRLKARSVINQAMEQVEDLVPDVPFVPRPVEDDEPERKATVEAMEKLAVGLVKYEVDGRVVDPPSYYDGEIDFPLYEEDDEDEGSDRPAS